MRSVFSIAVFLCCVSSGVFAQDQNEFVETYVPPREINKAVEPVSTSPESEETKAPEQAGATVAESVGDIDWSQVPQLSCTGAVHDVINNFSLNISEGQYIRSHGAEIADKLRIYHSIGVRNGLFVYDLKLENDHSRKGKTICACAEFQDGNMNNFPLAAIGGSWGMSPRKHRSDRRTVKVPAEITAYVTKVNVTAGYCPTDRLRKKIAKEAINAGWTTLRAYVAAKSGVVLPKEPPQ